MSPNTGSTMLGTPMTQQTGTLKSMPSQKEGGQQQILLEGGTKHTKNNNSIQSSFSVPNLNQSESIMNETQTLSMKGSQLSNLNDIGFVQKSAPIIEPVDESMQSG